MRKMFLILVVFVTFQLNVESQILYQGSGRVFADDVSKVVDLPENVSMEETKDSILKEIMSAFRVTNLNDIKPMLSMALQDEVQSIDSL